MGWSGGPPNARGPPARADMGEGGTRPKALQLDSTRLKALPGESWCMLLPPEAPVPLGVKLSDLHAHKHTQQARTRGMGRQHSLQYFWHLAELHQLVSMVAQIHVDILKEFINQVFESDLGNQATTHR